MARSAIIFAALLIALGIAGIGLTQLSSSQDAGRLDRRLDAGFYQVFDYRSINYMIQHMEFSSYRHNWSKEAYGALVQALFAILFYKMVAEKYTPLVEANDASAAIMKEHIACRCARSEKCILAYFCGSSQMGLLFEKGHLGSYWLGCLFNIFCPCPAVCYVLSLSALPEHLGGEPKDCLSGVCLAWCCLCCTVHMLVDAMDAATGQKASLCERPVREGDYDSMI